MEEKMTYNMDGIEFKTLDEFRTSQQSGPKDAEMLNRCYDQSSNKITNDKKWISEGLQRVVGYALSAIPPATLAYQSWPGNESGHTGLFALTYSVAVLAAVGMMDSAIDCLSANRQLKKHKIDLRNIVNDQSK
jgi:hypothetical protein